MGIYLEYYSSPQEGWYQRMLGDLPSWWAAWVEAARLVDRSLPTPDDPSWDGDDWLVRLATIACILRGDLWRQGLDLDFLRRLTPEDSPPWEYAQLPLATDFRLARRLMSEGSLALETSDHDEAASIDRLSWLHVYDVTYLLRFAPDDMVTLLMQEAGITGAQPLAPHGRVKWYHYPDAAELRAANPTLRSLWSYLKNGRSIRSRSLTPLIMPRCTDEYTFGWYSLAECRTLVSELERLEAQPEEDGHQSPAAAVERVRLAAEEAILRDGGMLFVAG